MKIAGISVLSAIFWSLPYLTALSVPLVMFSIVPAMYFLYSSKTIDIRYIILTAIVTSTIALFDVIHYSLPVYVAGIMVTAIFIISFLIISQKILIHSRGSVLPILIPPTVWTTLVLLFNFRSMLTGSFDIGIALPNTAPIVWYVGSMGITYIVVLWSSACARFLSTKGKTALAITIIIPLALMAMARYSLSIDPRALSAGSKPVKVALIQNNISRSWEWLQKNPYKILETGKEVTASISGERPDLIIWSEYALPIDIVSSHNVVRDAVGELARSAGADMVIGSVRLDRQTGWHDDIALVFDKTGAIAGERSSVNPAPFNKNTKIAQVKLSPLKNFGIVICWEELDPAISREYANNGAGFLVSITNNQDFNNARLKFYTPFYTKARAAENMRYIARAANTGITQIIDPLGRVVKSLKPDIKGALVGEIYPIHTKTFYTKHGPIAVIIINSIVWLFACISIISNSRSLKNKEVEHENYHF
jgi:apolipoprotein N-acyltransferase